MNWFYCLLIGHYLIAISFGRPEVIPLNEKPAVNQTNGSLTINPLLAQPLVDPKPLIPNKTLRANVVVDVGQPSTTLSTLPTSTRTPPPVTSTFGEKITLSTDAASHQPKRYIKNLVFKPVSNITAKYLNVFPPAPITATLDHPIYAYGRPATTGVALNGGVIDFLKKSQGQFVSASHPNPAESHERFGTSSSRPNGFISPSIQSIYQNLNFVSVPPSTQSPLPALNPPQMFVDQTHLQEALLRNKIRNEIEQLNNFASVSIPVSTNFKVTDQNAASFNSHLHASQNSPFIGTPANQNLIETADKLYYSAITPSNYLFSVTTESDPYAYYDRIQFIKNTQSNLYKPAPLPQPVVHIGYQSAPSQSHLSNMMDTRPNTFDTMTHSHNNKNRSEIHQIKTKSKLYINNNYITDINNDGSSTVGHHSNQPNWSTTNYDSNKNNNRPNAQNEQIMNEDENSNNKSGKNKQHNGGLNAFESNSGTNNDVNIVIKIDDKKTESNSNDETHKSTVSKDKGSSSHSGGSHSGGSHSNNGGGMKMKRRKKPQQSVVDHVQTIFLQAPTTTTTTTTTPAPLKTLQTVPHETHSKFSYLEKFLAVLPILSILKPLSFGFWTLALSPLLVVAAGGVAIAVILYPWLTLSHEHQVAAHNSRPPSLVIHRHSAPLRRRRPAIVSPIVRPIGRPIIRRPSKPQSIIWRDRVDNVDIESGPKTMQYSLQGVLEGQFIEKQMPKKNLLRREKRMSDFWANRENRKDLSFRFWLSNRKYFDSKNLLEPIFKYD